MNEISRVLLAINDPKIMQEVWRTFEQAEDFSVAAACQIDSELTNAVQVNDPDVLVLEYDETDHNTEEFLRYLKVVQACRQKIIAVSKPMSRRDAAKCIELGVRFLTYKPDDAENLLALARSVNSPKIITFEYMISKGRLDIESCIARMLLRCCIPSRMLGYRYLIDCILAILEDETLGNAVTKVLYPMVAKRHQTTGANVERNIRNAIRKGWERRSKDSDAQSNCLRRPTNQNFMLSIANVVRAEMRRKGMLTDGRRIR